MTHFILQYGLVLVFLVLFLSVLSVAYCQMAAALRAETARSLQARRDEGSIHALARGQFSRGGHCSKLRTAGLRPGR